jgi:transcriptional regulator with XRE-family HTH domain
MQLDLSLAEVAQLAECATSTVRHYERGLRARIDIEILKRICQVLRLRLSQVL